MGALLAGRAYFQSGQPGWESPIAKLPSIAARSSISCSRHPTERSSLRGVVAGQTWDRQRWEM